jgi:hypothetical protein
MERYMRLPQGFSFLIFFFRSRFSLALYLGNAVSVGAPLSSRLDLIGNPEALGIKVHLQE